MNDDERAAQRLMQALEMHDFGVEMMRQNLTRTYPDESADQIQQRLTAWLHDKPLPSAEPYLVVAEGRTIP